MSRSGLDYCRFAKAYAKNALAILSKWAFMNSVQREFAYAYCRSAVRLFSGKIVGGSLREPKTYHGKQIMTGQEGNNCIFKALSTDQPYAVLRYGVTELRPVIQYIGVMHGIFKNIDKVFGKYLCISSGFFPNEDKYLLEFGRVMLEASGQGDLLAVWFNRMEDYVAHKWMQSARLMWPRGSEPYYYPNPWTKALEGRKVLIIHPFVDSIRNQYEKKRDKLFANKDVLPEFDLHIVRAVQSVANTKCEFGNWFDALESMVEQASRIDYDIAIIGAGAYGFPLAARLKQQGKQAIHLGGATQLLFGIKGRRWDNMPLVAQHYNEHWVYPLEHEKPEKAEAAGLTSYWR